MGQIRVCRVNLDLLFAFPPGMRRLSLVGSLGTELEDGESYSSYRIINDIIERAEDQLVCKTFESESEACQDKGIREKARRAYDTGGFGDRLRGPLDNRCEIVIRTLSDALLDRGALVL